MRRPQNFKKCPTLFEITYVWIMSFQKGRRMTNLVLNFECLFWFFQPTSKTGLTVVKITLIRVPYSKEIILIAWRCPKLRNLSAAKKKYQKQISNIWNDIIYTKKQWKKYFSEIYYLFSNLFLYSRLAKREGSVQERMLNWMKLIKLDLYSIIQNSLCPTSNKLKTNIEWMMRS